MTLPDISSIPLERLFTNNQLTLIAGPCSAETEAQVMETALALKTGGAIDAFRAGVWKPRTRPNGFEGAGVKALPWLQRVQDELDIPVAVEVASPYHVDVCLKAGIKIFWIGARTSVNPFYVQEIAQALIGVDMPVLVKNPVSPDLSLWIGAIERFQQAGINRVAAIHRGFTPYEASHYRNSPLWSLAIKFKKLLPKIPMIADPSHIGGKRQFLAEIAQTALDLEYNGLMIETHPDPDHALSDAAQQVTPADFWKLIHELSIRTADCPNQEAKQLLDNLRQRIDQVDEQILNVFAERMRIVRQIAEVKKTHHITPLQMTRWSELLESRTQKGLELGLSDALLQKLYEIIHTESLAEQHRLINMK
jgi:chorismate mutase